MISCLVSAREGKWGAYALTNEQLEHKEQPTYLAPYEYPSQVWAALDDMLKEGENDGHTDYGSFWAKVREAGIDVPDSDEMSHRQKMNERMKEQQKHQHSHLSKR
jgi:hypothetical protein